MNLPEIFPKASADFLRINANLPVSHYSSPPASKPKRRVRNGALAEGKAKEGDSAFYLVRITSYRSRLIDSDNLCGKWHCDALRYSGILPSDAPDKALIQTTQVKVPKGQERTEITINLVTPMSPL